MAEKLSNRYSYQTFFCYERRRLRSVNTKFALQNPANGAAPAVGLGQTVLFISAKLLLTTASLFQHNQLPGLCKSFIRLQPV